MPKIRVIVEDDNGQQTEQTFVLDGKLDTLDAIDEALEGFKNETLPHTEKELLTQTQERLVAQEKKTLPPQQRQRHGETRFTSGDDSYPTWRVLFPPFWLHHCPGPTRLSGERGDECGSTKPLC